MQDKNKSFRFISVASRREYAALYARLPIGGVAQNHVRVAGKVAVVTGPAVLEDALKIGLGIELRRRDIASVLSANELRQVRGARLSGAAVNGEVSGSVK